MRSGKLFAKQTLNKHCNQSMRQHLKGCARKINLECGGGEEWCRWNILALLPQLHPSYFYFHIILETTTATKSRGSGQVGFTNAKRCAELGSWTYVWNCIGVRGGGITTRQRWQATVGCNKISKRWRKYTPMTDDGIVLSCLTFSYHLTTVRDKLNPSYFLPHLVLVPRFISCEWLHAKRHASTASSWDLHDSAAVVKKEKRYLCLITSLLVI